MGFNCHPGPCGQAAAGRQGVLQVPTVPGTCAVPVTLPLNICRADAAKSPSSLARRGSRVLRAGVWPGVVAPTCLLVIPALRRPRRQEDPRWVAGCSRWEKPAIPRAGAAQQGSPGLHRQEGLCSVPCPVQCFCSSAHPTLFECPTSSRWKPNPLGHGGGPAQCSWGFLAAGQKVLVV